VVAAESPGKEKSCSRASLPFALAPSHQEFLPIASTVMVAAMSHCLTHWHETKSDNDRKGTARMDRPFHFNRPSCDDWIN
jgi:hypothetical protein